METWAVAILSFMGGALVTALGYTYKFSNDLTAMKVQLENVVKSMNKPIAVPAEVTRALTQVCAATENLDRRVTRLEAKSEKAG